MLVGLQKNEKMAASGLRRLLKGKSSKQQGSYYATTYKNIQLTCLIQHPAAFKNFS